MGCVVYIHLLLSALLAQGVYHGTYVLGREERVTAERARADAFFHADYLAAIETVGSGGKEGMACCKTGAATG